MQHSAIFLDRDGTLNLNTDYPYRPEDLFILDGVSEAIALFKKLGYKLIIVTNQSGIGRGYFSEEQLKIFNATLEEAVGIHFDGIYRCPHLPEQGCDCRKPKPGLLIKAAQEHDIEMGKSYMIGDSDTDIQAGHAAGCTSFFVGNEHSPEADQTFLSLLAAAQYLRGLSAT